MNYSQEEPFDFASMLEQSFEPVYNGDMKEGTILSISDEAAIVDIGSFLDGILAADQLRDGDNLSNYRVGDRITVTVRRVDSRNSQIILSKKEADRAVAWKGLVRSFEEGEPTMVKVESAVKGGLRVSCGQARGFMPASQIDTRYVEDLSVYEGKELPCLILEVNEEEHSFTASRKAHMLQAQKEAKERAFACLEVGQTFSGTIVEIKPFGAFVEREDYVTGLIPIRDLSWTRVEDPSEVVFVGQKVDTIVTSVDRERERIGLSLRESRLNPYESLSFREGDILEECRVEKIIKSGAFIKLSDGMEGFLPISYLADHRVGNVREVIKEGESLRLRVMKIDPENHRITLSLRDAEEEGMVLDVDYQEEDEKLDMSGAFGSVMSLFQEEEG